MKTGIIILGDGLKTCMAAVRCASYHLMQGDDVLVFFVPRSGKDRRISLEEPGIRNETTRLENAGGHVYLCENTDVLNEYLKKHFHPFMSNRQASQMNINGRFRSFGNENVFIRTFRNEDYDE